MSNYSTYEEKLEAAIAAGEDLPEFTADVVNENGKVTKWGSVFVLNTKPDKTKGKSIDETVQYTAKLNDGLALVIFGRAGDASKSTSTKLQAEVTHMVELYVDPIKYLRKEGVRSIQELEEAVLTFLHGLLIEPNAHCNTRLQVKRWHEVGHPEMYATRIELSRPFGI